MSTEQWRERRWRLFSTDPLSVRRIRISQGRRHVHWTEVFDLEVPAPPYAKNPSRWSQRIPICVLAGMGAVLAGYMGLFQWEIIETVWDPVFGTGSEEVLTSSVAEQMDRWLHIPDSSFGAWAYFSEAILSLVGSTRRWQYRPWIVALFGIDVILLGGISAMPHHGSRLHHRLLVRSLPV